MEGDKLKIESNGYIVSSPLNIPNNNYILEFDVYHSIKCPINVVIQYNMNDGTFRADEGIYIHNNCLIRDYYDNAPSQTLSTGLNSNQFRITFEISESSIRVGYIDEDHNLMSEWKNLIYSSKQIGLRVESGYLEISNLRWRKRT